MASPLASKATLKSNGDITGVSASGEFNFTAGPREIPRVANVPDAAGKAASFALIKGAAKMVAEDKNKTVEIANLIKLMFTPTYKIFVNRLRPQKVPKIKGGHRHTSYYRLLSCHHYLSDQAWLV